jgi:hypothetical protein
MEVSGQLNATVALPPVPMDTRLGGPKSRSGRCGVNRNLLPLPRNEPRPSPADPDQWAINDEFSAEQVIYPFKAQWLLHIPPTLT